MIKDKSCRFCMRPENIIRKKRVEQLEKEKRNTKILRPKKGIGKWERNRGTEFVGV